MKLINKKTGELVDAWSFYDGNESVNLKYFTDDGQVNLEYNSLTQLNEDWEDYKPAEPLIKDEKIRKAVRTWAEANKISRASYNGDEWRFEFNDFGEASIQFISPLRIEDGTYAIAELCGEEEQCES